MTTTADAFEALYQSVIKKVVEQEQVYESAITPSEIDFAGGQVAAYKAIAMTIAMHRKVGFTDAQELASLRDTIAKQQGLLDTQRQTIELQEKTITTYEKLTAPPANSGTGIVQ